MTLSTTIDSTLSATGDLLLALSGTALLVGPFGTLLGLWGPGFLLQMEILDPFVLVVGANGLWLLSSLVLSYPFVTRQWSFQSLTVTLPALYLVWIVGLLTVVVVVGGDVRANPVLVSILTVGAYGAAAGSWTLAN